MKQAWALMHVRASVPFRNPIRHPSKSFRNQQCCRTNMTASASRMRRGSEHRASPPPVKSRYNVSPKMHRSLHQEAQAGRLQYSPSPFPDKSGRVPQQETEPDIAIRGSQKRKIRDLHHGRSSVDKRRRVETQGPEIKDETWVKKHMDLPETRDYPKLLANNQAKTVIHNIKQSVDFELKCVHSKNGPPFNCSLECRFFGETETIKVTGEGRTKRAAEWAAYLMVLSEMHTSGFLKENDPDQQKSLSSEVLAEEGDAKIDVYDYAARFDATPQFSVRLISKRARAKSKKAVEVKIALPQQEISAVGSGPDARHAEVAACLRFKQAAEAYYAKSNTESLIVKDSTAISSKNAKKYIEYYKLVNKAARFDVVTTEVQSHWEAHVLLDGEQLGEAVEYLGKKKAEDLAYLTAALELKRRYPSLFPGFFKALEAGNGEVLQHVSPVSMRIDDECLTIMADTLYDSREAGLPDVQEDLLADVEGEGSDRRIRLKAALSPERTDERSRELKTMLQVFQKNPRIAELRAKREELPMNQYASKVLELINNNIYSIIIGATGSGKTTQVPQILLDDAIKDDRGGYCNIICTQPRRIAATSVARRVAEERNQSLGESIGYHVRFDPKHPRSGGSVTYCTTGILLQQLQHAPNEVLDRHSHLIIDEVHERDILIDFLLIVLKRAVSERQKLGKSIPRIVLMSATIDTELFAGYFNQMGEEGRLIDCPSLSVPGRLFPVTSTYLPELMRDLENKYPAHFLNPISLDKDTTEYMDLERDFQRSHSASGQDGDMGVATINWKQERKAGSSDGENILLNERQDALVPFPLIAMTISHITQISNDGAILVFLPGLDEILKVEEALLTLRPLGVNFTDNPSFKIIKVHSSLATGQTEVFQAVPPGCRKIILSTNIAETSVTIPDVQFVLDTGKLREKRYDQVRRISRLACTWISKSNATQRAGRAGRVQNGNYYALYSRNRFESLRAIGLPEMLRSDLQEICLDIKAQAFKSPIREFLAQAIEPPTPKAVDTSVVNLQALEALTDDEEITPLGRLLASLPVHPGLGKMIILGIIFRCLDPMLIIGAAAAERNLFVSTPDRRAEAEQCRQSFSGGEGSDFITLYNAFQTIRQVRETRGYQAAFNFAYENFIHMGAFRSVEAIARQIRDTLVEARLIPFSRSDSRAFDYISDPSLNTNSANVGLIKGLALAGHHPNLALSLGGRRLRTPQEAMTMIHPSSTNYPKSRSDLDAWTYGRLFTYGTMARSNDGKSLFLRDTSESTPLMACLFGGRLRASGDRIEMGSWLPFRVRADGHRGKDWHVVKTLMEFRKALERLLSAAFQDLTKMRLGGAELGMGANSQPAYLADAGARKVFADGLVAVLDRDINNEKRDAERARIDGRERNREITKPQFEERAARLTREGGGMQETRPRETRDMVQMRSRDGDRRSQHWDLPDSDDNYYRRDRKRR